MKNRTLRYCILATIIFTFVLSVVSHEREIARAIPVVEPLTEEAVTIDVVSPKEISVKNSIPETSKALPAFTEESLARYDGNDPSLPIYIALEGSVYDVSSGAKFYAIDGDYNFLAGTDGTMLLKIVGGDIIKKKYPVIGTYTK